MSPSVNNLQLLRNCATVQYVNAVVRLLGQQLVLVASDYIYASVNSSSAHPPASRANPRALAFF